MSGRLEFSKGLGIAGLAVILVAAFGLLVACGDAVVEPKPNVILIFADDPDFVVWPN
jgi:hypothetical protein